MENVEPTRSLNAANAPPPTVPDTARLPGEEAAAAAQVMASFRQAQAGPNAPEELPASLEAAEVALLASKTEALAHKAETLALGLPEFRDSSPEEMRKAETLLREAHFARKRENFKEAEAKCREALALAPRDAAALELLGDLYQGVAKIEEALAAYKRALQADPKRTSAEKKYAGLLMRQQSWDSVDMEDVRKNPRVAALLSLLLPGAGQIYKGQWARGLLILIVMGLCIYSYQSNNVLPAPARPGEKQMAVKVEKGQDVGNMNPMIPLVLGGCVYIFNVWDAARKAGSRRPGGKTGWEV